ncbi:MAG: hypothetical protein DDT40_01559 [candidate division WS2 bacterium]|nr:hypothetical protein [Candidatus Psychracetigena formicireducens]
MGFTVGDKVGKFDPIPDGLYPVRLDEWSMDRTKRDNMPLLRLRFVVTEGDYAGRMLFDQVKVAEDGIWRACTILAALDVAHNQYFETAQECADFLVLKLEEEPSLRIVVGHAAGIDDPSKTFNKVIQYVGCEPASHGKGKPTGDEDTPPW